VAEIGTICPTPTPTVTATPTVTPTITNTNTPTITVTPTVTPTFVPKSCFKLSSCTDNFIYSGCSSNNLSIGSTYQLILNLSAGTKNNKFVTGNGFDNLVVGLNYQSDGKILVSGNFSQYDSNTLTNEIIRLNQNGSIDNTFNYTGTEYIYVNDVIQQNDGKVLVGLGQTNGISGNIIQRTNSDGTIDGSFYNIPFPNGGAVSKIKIEPSGKIYLAGTFNYPDNYYQHKLCRLFSDGTLDPTFGNGGFLVYLGS